MVKDVVCSKVTAVEDAIQKERGEDDGMRKNVYVDVVGGLLV